MSKVRTLLLALMLPALVLPGGLTLCLCRLFSCHAHIECVASCCSDRKGTSGRTFESGVLRNCYLPIPAIERVTNRSPHERVADSLPPLTIAAVAHGDLVTAPEAPALQQLVRDPRDLHPPPLSLRSLPLRL